MDQAQLRRTRRARNAFRGESVPHPSPSPFGEGLTRPCRQWSGLRTGGPDGERDRNAWGGGSAGDCAEHARGGARRSGPGADRGGRAAGAGAGPGADPARRLRGLRLEPDALGRAGLDALPDRARRARPRGLGRRRRGRRGRRGPGARASASRRSPTRPMPSTTSPTPAPSCLCPRRSPGEPFPGEPLGCAMNIFRRSGIEAGQTVAIVGIGFLGAILTRLAADAGARVIAISRRPFSLEVARAHGRRRDDPDGRPRRDHRAGEGADRRRCSATA